MFTIHKLTGSQLVDGQGRPMGAESAGVVSRHRTLEAAERAMERLSRSTGAINAGRYQIRDESGNPVESNG